MQCAASFLGASDTNLHRIRHAFPWKVNSASGLTLLPEVTSNSRLNAASSPAPTDVDVSPSRTERRLRFRMKFRSSSLRSRHPVPSATPDSRLLQGTVKSPPREKFHARPTCHGYFPPVYRTLHETPHNRKKAARLASSSFNFCSLPLLLFRWRWLLTMSRCLQARYGTKLPNNTISKSKEFYWNCGIKLRWIVRCRFVINETWKLLLGAMLSRNIYELRVILLPQFVKNKNDIILHKFRNFKTLLLKYGSLICYILEDTIKAGVPY